MRIPRAVLALHAVLLLVQVWLLRDISRAYSPTADEIFHLPVGMMTLASGDVRLCFDDPPLQNYVNAIPAFLFMTARFRSIAKRGVMRRISAPSRALFSMPTGISISMYSQPRVGRRCFCQLCWPVCYFGGGGSVSAIFRL